MRIQGMSGLYSQYLRSFETGKGKIRDFIRTNSTFFYYILSFPEEASFETKLSEARLIYSDFGLDNFFDTLMPQLRQDEEDFSSQSSSYESLCGLAKELEF